MVWNIRRRCALHGIEIPDRHKYLDRHAEQSAARGLVLTYHVFKQLKRWRLDHISLAAAPSKMCLPIS